MYRVSPCVLQAWQPSKPQLTTRLSIRDFFFLKMSYKFLLQTILKQTQTAGRESLTVIIFKAPSGCNLPIKRGQQHSTLGMFNHKFQLSWLSTLASWPNSRGGN